MHTLKYQLHSNSENYLGIYSHSKLVSFNFIPTRHTSPPAPAVAFVIPQQIGIIQFNFIPTPNHPSQPRPILPYSTLVAVAFTQRIIFITIPGPFCLDVQLVTKHPFICTQDNSHHNLHNLLQLRNDAIIQFPVLLRVVWVVESVAAEFLFYSVENWSESVSALLRSIGRPV